MFAHLPNDVKLINKYTPTKVGSPNCKKPTSYKKFLAQCNISQSPNNMALAGVYTAVSIAVELFFTSKQFMPRVHAVLVCNAQIYNLQSPTGFVLI